MPHVWTVLGEARPIPRSRGRRSSGRSVPPSLSGALFTLRLSLGGLVLGGVLGVLLAVVMQRSGLLERALLPYVVASQTVPLIAIAPLVAGWGGKIAVFGQPWQPWASVMVIAAYLAFFPIAVGVLRGLASPRPRTSSCSARWRAGWWTTLLRLRLPASVPYLIPAAPARRRRRGDRRDRRRDLHGHPRRHRPADHRVRPGGHRRPVAACTPPSSARPCSASSRPAAVGLLDLALRRYQGSRPDERRRADRRRQELIGVDNAVRATVARAVGHRAAPSAPGEFVSLIGPSGCGKSTLLRVVADLEQPSDGSVAVDGKSARQARLDQDYGIAFQQSGLLEWRTVAENVELPLHVHGVAQGGAPGPRGRAARAGRPRRLRRARGPASCRAACSSGWRSPGRWPPGRSCCSWTSRSARWTR